MTKALLVLLLLGATIGCAPTVLEQAARIPHFEAKYIQPDGDSAGAGFDRLRARLDEWGVTVETLAPDQKYLGLANATLRTIWIRTDVSINAQFEILAHEAGHLLQPVSIDDATAQVFAELVGVGVTRHGGHDASTSAAAYLAALKHAFPGEKHLRRDIAWAVRVLTGQAPLPQWVDR